MLASLVHNFTSLLIHFATPFAQSLPFLFGKVGNFFPALLTLLAPFLHPCPGRGLSLSNFCVAEIVKLLTPFFDTLLTLLSYFLPSFLTLGYLLIR